ncbi:Cytochrome P450 [Metarhizium album ARSEF 1941]|uniref:Cytochrome P450 n=1 Tax=Metarhizium album (strain ARSEF 1941) TaxID=1081103 RepID=A0A0B2WVS4_METAS|nr:Cytochrome P450 [Metarhizium album ARSEF 1941]KHN97557.1 Cytochrome P450 [Metarhizium album ARSEF 1941]
MASVLIAGVGVTIVTYFIYLVLFRKRRVHDLPPGPKPVPLLGNVRDLPPGGVSEFRHWLPHKDLYGPISSVRVLSQTIVILHDRDAAHELLTKMSSKSSDRPTSEFANNLCGYGRLFVLGGDDERFRRCRKMVHQHIGTKASAARFDDTQNLATHEFLLRVLLEPSDLFKHLDDLAGASVLRITYGYTISKGPKDPLVELIQLSSSQLGLAGSPGAWAVDAVPALKYLPDWFPGTGFKQTARQFRKVAEQMAQVPYEFVLRQMAAGTHKTSFVSRLVQEHDEKSNSTALTPRDEDEIKNTAAVMYLGGSETIATAMRVFVLCMILFPQVQRKAQKEMDEVLGPCRLPSPSDRQRLPYMDALVKEAYRWSPAIPLGLAHATSEEVVCSGYFVPKGSIILPCVWWFFHDPSVYRNPDDFEPERYLEPRNERDPRLDAFGYGRRMCPGRYLADTLLFLTFAQLLASFTIREAVDEQGKGVRPELALGSGIACFPKEFPYAITPRSAAHADTIRRLDANRLGKTADSDRLEIEALMRRWDG